jgi:RecB family exonuclease
VNKFTAWSPSRLADYDACPRSAKYKHLDKLCPVCFKGALKGWDPQVCTLCGKSPETGEALVRGTAIHKQAEEFVKGISVAMDVSLKNAKKLLRTLRTAARAGKVQTELDLVVNRAWRPVQKFSHDAWGRFKIDILHIKSKTTARVIDWKTGGVDKKTKEVRDDAKYEGQLSAYATVVASVFPAQKEVTAALVFLDAPEGANIVEKPQGTVRAGADLKAHQESWEKRVLPMFSDETFAPSPNYTCRWCPFCKGRGGPCPY